MKRLISLIIISGLVLSVCSCSKKGSDSSSEESSETEITEITEATESETVSVETTETTESETVPTETSETTTTKETTTTMESETEAETKSTEKARGNVFIDCSGKSADQIVTNINAIRTISDGIPFESYPDRFAIAPEMEHENCDDITDAGYNWFEETIGSNDYITQITLSADFEDGKIYVDSDCGVSVMMYLSDLGTAEEVFDKVNSILANEYAEAVELDEVELNDDRSGYRWEGIYGARSVILDVEPNDQGLYYLYVLIDVVPT